MPIKISILQTIHKNLKTKPTTSDETNDNIENENIIEDFTLIYKNFCRDFENFSLKQFSKLTNNWSKNTKDPFIVKTAYHALSLFDKGKRLRPYIAYLSFCDTRENSENLRGPNSSKKISFSNDFWKTVYSLELFHLFALIHDDIIDQSKLRRGIPTVHEAAFGFLNTSSYNYERSSTQNNKATSMALLIGDAIIVKSLALLHNLSTEIKELFTKMAEEVIFGQMEDVSIKDFHKVSLARIKSKTIKKTASYTFIYPALMGQSLATLSCTSSVFNLNQNKQMFFYRKLGEKMGLAFQLQDDLFDILPTTTIALDKPKFQDIKEGAPTFCTYYAFQNGSEKDKTELLQILKKKILQKNDEENLIQIFDRSGTYGLMSKKVKEAYSETKSIVDKNDELSQASKERWLGLIRFLETRQS